MTTPPFLSYRSFRSVALWLILTFFGVLSFSHPCAAQIRWIGPDSVGGSGEWQNSNFSGSTGQVDTYFDTDDTTTAQESVITVDAGSVARTQSLVVRNYVAGTTKSVTINLGDGSELYTGYYLRSRGLVNVGGGGFNAHGHTTNPTEASTSILTINGPEIGNAIFRATRFYLEGNGTANVGTTHRNSLILDGPNLVVELDGDFSSVGRNSDILFDGGVTVNTSFRTSGADSGKNLAGALWIRSGMTSSRHDAWITVRHATLALHTIDNRGLFQLDAQGVLLATAATDAEDAPKVLNIRVGQEGAGIKARFEAAGSGIDSLAEITVYKQATFAIGVSDPKTLISNSASSFTLDQSITFHQNSELEFDIFGQGSDQADRLTIGGNGRLEGSAKIVLNLNGYLLQSGDAWSLIDTTDASENWFEDTFDLSGLDTAVWDLSDFNAAGGWTIRAIPEPSTYSLLGLVVLGLFASIKMVSLRVK